jgi:hypothetical protein
MMLRKNIVTVLTYLPTCSDLGAPAWHSFILWALLVRRLRRNGGNRQQHHWSSLQNTERRADRTDPAHSFSCTHARVLAQTGWSSGNSMWPMGATVGGGPDLPCIIVTLG